MSSNNSTIAIPDDHWADAINLVSSTIASTAYGIMFTLYLICCHSLMLQITHKQEKRRSAFFICYITAMFVFGTIYVATSTHGTVVSYVYYANFPGGPSAYTNLVLFSAPVGIISNVSYILANWFADAMLLWRLIVLFQGFRHRTLVVAFPALLFLGSLAMGFTMIVQISLPNGSLWANGEIKFALPYFVSSVFMSVIATGLMVWRMLSVLTKLRFALGNQQTTPYTHVAAILVESCALYAIFSLTFIVLFAINHPIQYIFLSALGNVQIIAPLLIIFRVSKGEAWNRRTTELISSVPESAKHVTPDEGTTLKMTGVNIDHSTTLVTHEGM